MSNYFLLMKNDYEAITGNQDRLIAIVQITNYYEQSTSENGCKYTRNYIERDTIFRDFQCIIDSY